jgi:uncharacterized membrane protein
MDSYGKVNHLFKLFGLILILLAITAFAHSTEYRFDCYDEFNCSIKSYCQDVSGAFPGLLVHNGTATSYTLGAQPIDYSFEATPGEYFCSASVTVTAFHSQNQANETTTLFINGIDIGTTEDKYCNGDVDEDCTFCGRDTQNLGISIVDLERNNTITIEGHESHAIVAVVLDCVPTRRRTCVNNLDPRWEEIDDKEIPYDSDFKIDLWDYAHDADNSFTELTFDMNVEGVIDCNIEDNRYLFCESHAEIGEATIDLAVTDDCNSTAHTSFDVTVTNAPPAIRVPDQTVSCASDLNKFIDLWDYSFDEDLDLTTIELISQTNTDLMTCQIDENNYLTCDINACSEDQTEINVEITDIFGEVDTDTFIINIINYSPDWDTLPSPCLNDNEYKFIDLRDYAYDLEDKNDLDFELTNQTNDDLIDCFLDDDYFISCDSISNQHGSNLLTLKAIDSGNKFAETEMEIETNCFFDGNKRFEFSAEQRGICLEECVTYNTQLTLKNNSTQRECFNFELSYSGYLRTDLGNASSGFLSFCLNEGETSRFPLNISTYDADNEDYVITVEDKDQNISLEFELEIGDCENFDGFRVHEYEAMVCQGEERDFSVDVTNTSEKRRTIDLMADSTMLLPYFLKNKVTLDAGEKETVQLHVNAKHVEPGKYRLFLGGDATNYHIEKYFLLEVQDCSNIEERNFIITAPQVCFDVSRGQIFESSFSIRKLSECGFCSLDEKTVDLFLFGMPNELSYDTVTLEGSEEKQIDFAIFVPENAKAGTQLLTITGEEREELPFDSEIGFIEDETICVNVLGESNSLISVRTQAKDILWCDSEIFELEIINNGDFDEAFDLSSINLPRGVTVSLSQDQVIVPKGSSKIIYVSISTDPNSLIKDNQFITIVLDGNMHIETKIYFNVKEKAEFEDIEILSSTEMLSLRGNTEGKYHIQLRNNSEREFRNLKISFENVPTDINFEEKVIASIVPGQIITIEGKVIVGDTNGYFIPSFVIESNTVLNKELFQLYIVKDDSFFSGLFGFGSFGTGAFLLVGPEFAFGALVLLILLVVVIILGVNALESRNEEGWVMDNE